MRKAMLSGLIVMALAGCSSSASSCDPVTTSGTESLHLYVSNQSFDIDPVDIEVHIDGQAVICNDFFVEGQHNWVLHDLTLDPGDHTLRAVGNGATTTFEETFQLDGEHWAVLDFWFSPGETEEFTFWIQDSPIGFA